MATTRFVMLTADCRGLAGDARERSLDRILGRLLREHGIDGGGHREREFIQAAFCVRTVCIRHG